MSLLDTIKLRAAKHAPRIARKFVYKKYASVGSSMSLPKGWSEYELLLLPVFLKKNSVFLDVGSNLGVYINAALLQTQSEYIHGFEPQSVYFDYLRKVFSEVTVSSLALSSKSGEASLCVPRVSGVKKLPRAQIAIEKDDSLEMVDLVKTATLDEYVKDNALDRIDLIKIDVEGHENSVLEGAIDSLERFKPCLIVEVEERHNDNAHHVFELLEQKGYAAIYFDALDMQAKVFKLPLVNVQKSADIGSERYVNNFIFIPKKDSTHYLKAIAGYVAGR